ncbi:hypothetical protein CLAVI_000494 [Candidatus Clavichlamydia salmonicola]|uniref:hypothetical protein n=1 Tax=Candidatus Clavichlamydia salmonicola TaxID=469812 RepID=UPI001891A373|nr:hypothetical protein [Candidatus Clavichlamydia salmonicola]MBF5050872.1 hypothetical protein [Candidatus Clavichlamydia salmonicola]
MLQINHILSYAGLRAPSSPREALRNIKQNTLKFIEIASALIIGSLALYSDTLCNDCLLCFPESNNALSPSLLSLSNKCAHGIAMSSIICTVIVYKLNPNSFFSCCKYTHRKNCWRLTKSIFLLSVVIINSSLTIACIIESKSTTIGKPMACSLTGLMSALLGSGYILFSFNELFFLLFSTNLPALPEPIEMTLITPLRTEIDHPLQPTTTQLLDLLGRVDQIFSHLLDKALNDDTIIDEDVELMLNKALYLLQKINSIFLIRLANYEECFLLKINELYLISKNIITPIQLEHNITAISTILGKIHTLIRDLVALHPIALPREIRLALPSFQALCPPPEYTEENTTTINISIIPTSHPLYLASPPSYEEHYETAVTSF